MKVNSMQLAGLCLGLSILVFSCQPKEVDAWQKFMACSTNACVAEVLAVKDAFLADPKPLFEEFILTNERGEDHFVGWSYILRDSVIFNPNYETEAVRTAMQQAIIAKSKEYEADPKYGEWATSIINTISAPVEGEAAGSDQGFTGTYTYDLGEEVGSGQIKILAIDDKTLRFALEIVGRAPAYNQGTMEGTATYVGNVATISTTEFGGQCTITLTFADDQLVAETKADEGGGCGFGNNVRADGTYKLVDDLDPFRGEGGDEAPKEIIGNWVSTQDPKSEIQLLGGEYLDIYEGKTVDKNPFSYHKSCPEACAPVADTPCIKVTGQDDVCYVVVKADGKTLELSMIGGTGNTLVYKKK